MAKDTLYWSGKDIMRENSAPRNDGERPRRMYVPESSEDKKSHTRNQPSASGDGLKGASGRNAKPPAAAELANKGVMGNSLESIMRAGLSDPEEGMGGSSKSPLWSAFARSRSANERMRPKPPPKEWRTLKDDMAIPEAFRMWYNQVRGDRPVPHALNGLGFPSGFPEFCHWVADGHHESSGGNLMAGFEAMAVECVKRVRAAQSPASKSAAPGSRASHLFPPSFGGRSGQGEQRVGAMDPKDRKRERRARKGGAFDNESPFAEKMKNAIAGLEIETEEETEGGADGGLTGGGGGKGGTDVGKSRTTATDRASTAGASAEAEVGVRTKAEMGPGTDSGELLGGAFEGSELPPDTQAMMSSLMRAKAFRHRSERQAELLEGELERCLARMARVEAQYRALVAETRGKECSLQSALEDALPLIKAAEKRVKAETAWAAVEHYDDAIKLLEVHVEQSTGAMRESEEMLRARELLGLSLCNRSIIKLYLGDTYSGKRDAVRAEKVWPEFQAKEHLKRSQEVSEKQSKGAFTICKIIPVPL